MIRRSLFLAAAFLVGIGTFSSTVAVVSAGTGPGSSQIA